MQGKAGCAPTDRLTTGEQRCYWCAYPVARSPRRVVVDVEPFQGAWCTANCAVSFFSVFRRETNGNSYVRVLQNCTGTADDVEWGPAPEPHDFEWWTPGGHPREQFLAACRVISLRPDPVLHDPVQEVRQGGGLLELFERAAPQRSSAAKRRRLTVGKAQNQNSRHQEEKS